MTFLSFKAVDDCARQRRVTGCLFVKNHPKCSPTRSLSHWIHTFWGQRPLVPPPPRPSIFLIILFESTTLLTRMTGISLHMQWPLTSQSHGSVSKREQLSFLLRIKLHAHIVYILFPTKLVAYAGFGN
jgi:hypothetical protein